MNEILNDFFMGKQDLKTTEDMIIQTLEFMAANNPNCELVCYATEKTLEKNKIPDKIKTYKIPNAINTDKRIPDDTLFIIPIKR